MGKQQVKVIQQLRSAALRDGNGMTDGELLGRFVDAREETALEALVVRHSPMVWRVCRRVLENHHEAEDAFQASFLVLVRRAHVITPREMLSNWLYGVAYQTALKGRAMAAKRKSREKQTENMPEPATTPASTTSELQACLDREVSKLPDKYRAVIVLCELEGKTIKVVAEQLGIPEGTVAGRLSRGRELLRRRLTRRSPVLAGAALAGLLSVGSASAMAPAPLVDATVRISCLVAAGRSAAGMISANVAALADVMVKGMLLGKFKMAIAFAAIASLLGPLGALAFWGGSGDGGDNLQPPPIKSPVVVARANPDNALVSKYLDIDLGNGVTLKAVRIDAGKFIMGSPRQLVHGLPDEHPQHEVEITNPFFMGVYLVTQEEYERVMGTNPSQFKGARLPVENVSWADAMDFCRRLSDKTGKSFDLPTEAEWEYACRAGTTGYFAFGSELTTKQAQIAAEKTAPVGSFEPNAFGLYDMHGNVWEWCKDWYADDYYKRSPAKDPQGPPTGEFRVVRGGCWKSGGHLSSRSAYRSHDDPNSWSSMNGFRVVLRQP